MHQVDRDTLLELKSKVDTCKLCHGTDLKCSCYKEYFLAYQVVSAGIPSKYRKFTLKDIDFPATQTLVKRIDSYIRNIDENMRKGMGLCLYGNSGTGKTVLCSIVLIEALRKGYTCYFTTVDQYRNALFNKDLELIAQVHNVHFLLLDDIGREHQDSKGFIDSTLDELIRIRTDNLLPTLITTNKGPENAVETFRFASIVKEHFISLAFTAPDYRKKIQEKLTHEEKKKSKEK